MGLSTQCAPESATGESTTRTRILPVMIRMTVFLALSCLGSFLAAPPVHADELREGLRHRLEVLDEPGELVAGGERLYAVPSLLAFYEQRGWQPTWFDNGHDPLPSLSGLVPAVEDARNHGLVPEPYHLAALRSGLEYLATTRPAQRDPRKLSDIELLASDAFLTLARHYADGQVDPASIDPGWHLERELPELMESLSKASGGGRGAPKKALAAVLPSEPAYRVLVEQLALQRQLATDGEWPDIAGGESLHPGDEDARVPVIRQRLIALDDHPPTKPDGKDADIYDETLAAAVRHFQARHGLKQDAVVGRQTIAALNVTPEARANQLRANMERWRWLPQSFGEEYIIVNIAAFSMDVISSGERVMRKRVIVGQPYRRTPVFTGRMTYLVLNPSWEVPASLAVRDKLPEIIDDPDYLSRLGFAVLQGWGAEERRVDPGEVNWQALSASDFPYRLRQAPGPENALGRVKFMFPNEHNVYLHDTPTRGLFAEHARAFSSGCIRVENPIEVVEWLLGGPNRPAVMRSDEFQGILDGGKETTVQLGEAVPVHLLYWTAWVEADGTVHYRHDIYGRDEPLIEAFNQSPPGDT